MLELRDLCMNYEGAPLLRDCSLTIGAGQTVCLLGPSGSGKTTLLRIAAGLESPLAGSVRWEGTDITTLPPERRQFGLMFQDYALFPHLDVRANVAFGLRMQGCAPSEMDARVRDALALVGMEAFAARRVDELSGGEQQRIALARTLAPRPRMIMLDEPLGAMDRVLREDLAREIRRILRRTGVPALYVTHDQEEAALMGDRLALLHRGRIVQEGAPAELRAHPVDAWVARFLGLGNLIEGRVRPGSPPALETDLGVFAVVDRDGVGFPEGSRVWALLDPRGGRLLRRRSRDALEGTVLYCVALAESHRIVAANEHGQEFHFHWSAPLLEGAPVIWRPSEVWILPDGD